MTVGIGGWGSRRKPMALVRALLPVVGARTSRIVSYGGPDVGLLCRAGKVREVVYAFVSLDSIALEPHFRNARQAGAVSTTELDEGMFLLGLQAAAWRVPFLPTRVGLGSDVMRLNPALRTVTSPYADGEELVAMPALDARRRARSTCTAATRAAPASTSNVDPVLRRPHVHGRDAAVHVGREDRRHRGVPRRRAAAVDPHQPADDRRRGRDAARRALHRVRARLPARRGVPDASTPRRAKIDEAWDEFRGRSTST